MSSNQFYFDVRPVTPRPDGLGFSPFVWYGEDGIALAYSYDVSEWNID